jgi:hypothetical protein
MNAGLGAALRHASRSRSRKLAARYRGLAARIGGSS